MKRFESPVKEIAWPQSNVYRKVSDLSNLRALADRIPQEQAAQFKVDDLQCTPDSVSCSVSPVGQIAIDVVSREPEKCVKMETRQSPIKMTMWIQLVPTGESSCKMKITVDADLNIFMAKMVEKPLTEAVGRIADMLSMIPYNE